MSFANGVSGGGGRLAPIVLGLALGLALAVPVALAQGSDPASRPYPHGEWQGDCALCHDEAKWNPARPTKEFDHGKYFALQGAHRTAACRACHKTLEFTKARSDCVGCHQDVHRGEFGQDCGRCHTPRSFIDRASMARLHHTTRFPLTGSHAAADCDQCHLERAQGQLRYVGLPSDCASCHDNPTFKTATQRPQSHVEANYSRDCSQCHNTVSFAGGTINHAATGFPLTGAHATLECVRCHGTPFNPNLSPDCYSCHAQDYQGTTDPNHVQSGFPHDCAICHTTTSWAGATFNHSTTSFPLTGAHVGLACSACHADGVYQGKSTACYSCHQADYNGTTDPNHVQANFPQDCALCHTTASWAGATFNHANTSFPLTGAHVGQPCSACHADGVYNGKSTACYSCHKPAYDGTTDPKHSTAGLSTDCTLCHNTTTFAGAKYIQHDSLYFPIYSGNHNGRWTNCSDCHTNSSNYSVFSCFRCHSQAETDPRHTNVSGYRYDSAACYSCHPRGSAGN